MSKASSEAANGLVDGDAPARFLAILRAASASGSDLRMNAAMAGELADHIEGLARETNTLAATSRSLAAQLNYIQVQFDELLEMYDQLKALFVLGRDDGD